MTDQPTPQSQPTIKVGMRVRVKSGAQLHKTGAITSEIAGRWIVEFPAATKGGKPITEVYDTEQLIPLYDTASVLAESSAPALETELEILRKLLDESDKAKQDAVKKAEKLADELAQALKAKQEMEAKVTDREQMLIMANKVIRANMLPNIPEGATTKWLVQKYSDKADAEFDALRLKEGYQVYQLDHKTFVSVNPDGETESVHHYRQATMWRPAAKPQPTKWAYAYPSIGTGYPIYTGAQASAEERLQQMNTEVIEGILAGANRTKNGQQARRNMDTQLQIAQFDKLKNAKGQAND